MLAPSTTMLSTTRYTTRKPWRPSRVDGVLPFPHVLVWDKGSAPVVRRRADRSIIPQPRIRSHSGWADDCHQNGQRQTWCKGRQHFEVFCAGGSNGRLARACAGYYVRVNVLPGDGSRMVFACGTRTATAKGEECTRSRRARTCRDVYLTLGREM